eukprot:COSAG05_NODE_435_length_9845_cov_24.433364_6_plen_85_part_00
MTVPFVKPKDRQRLHRGHQQLWKCILYTLGLTTHPKPLVHKGMTNRCTFQAAHCDGCLGLLLLLWLQLLLVCCCCCYYYYYYYY